MGNRQRILDLSLELMNREGAPAAGMTRIAEDLGISPGNLYYHFKSREEIVRVLFDALEAEFRAGLTENVTVPVTPARFAEFYLHAFDLAWKYRFFFGGLLYLLRRDEVLAVRYRELQDWALARIETLAGQVVADGSMSRPKGRHGLRSVAVNTWIIWSNWVRFLQISGKEEIASADVIAGVGQLFDVLAPYLDTDFRTSARRVLMRNLPR